MAGASSKDEQLQCRLSWQERVSYYWNSAQNRSYAVLVRSVVVTGHGPVGGSCLPMPPLLMPKSAKFTVNGIDTGVFPKPPFHKKTRPTRAAEQNRTK